MMIGMVLFWAALVGGLAWLVRNGLEHRQERPEETALAVLDRRLAEGAVSLDDYHRRRDVLMGTSMPRPDRDAGPRESERNER